MKLPGIKKKETARLQSENSNKQSVPAEDKQEKKDRAEIRLFLKRLAIFVIAMVLIFTFVFRIRVVPNDDMKPAIRIGDFELIYCLPSARRVGQVIYYEKDGQKRNGRIVAVPGDTVEIKNNSLFINGNITTMATDYYSTPAYEGEVIYPLKLGDDEYFVLSDYREGAQDSRNMGPVRNNEIIGNVITILRRSQI